MRGIEGETRAADESKIAELVELSAIISQMCSNLTKDQQKEAKRSE